MKKNKMMRLASCLLVLCLLSTCAISGTFAKYVTSDSGEDKARVAKFGVVVEAGGTLFDKNYLDVDNGNTPAGETTANLTVQSSNDDNLVAPGTKNDTGMTFSITGTPEVKVKVEIAVSDSNDEAVKDVFLKANSSLPNMTTGNDDQDTFNNAADYYPIKYTLKKDNTDVKTGTLSEIEAYLEGQTVSQTYDAGTDLSTAFGTYTLTWEWDFDDSGKGTNDKQDTLLGDIAAGTITTLTAGTDYNLNTDVKISITVTQVD